MCFSNPIILGLSQSVVFLVVCFSSLTVGCDVPPYSKGYRAESAVLYSFSLWSGLCPEGQRFDHRNLLSNFVIQHHQFNALFYLHRHVCLFSLVSKTRITYQGLKVNFCLEVYKSPRVVPEVVFLFVWDLESCSPYHTLISSKFRNKKPTNSPLPLSLRSPSLSVFIDIFTTCEAGVP